MKQGEPRKAVCENCGSEFTACSNRTALCPGCRKAIYRERWRAKRKQYEAEKRKRKQEQEAEQKQTEVKKRAERSWKAVAEIQAEAAKAGLSYGQYVARMEDRKL